MQNAIECSTKNTFCVCPLHNLCIWGAKLPLENATNARFVYILPEPLMRGRPLPALFRWGIQKHTDVPAFRRIIIPHFFFSFVAKKNRTMRCFSIKIKGNSLLFCLFVRKWEVWSCEGADGAFALGVEELWRQRQKCQHIICQNAIHCVENKGQGGIVCMASIGNP